MLRNILRQKRLFSTGTEKPKKLKFDYIYGLNPVMASLSANRRIFNKLYLNISEKDETKIPHPKIKEVRKIANHFGIKTKFLTKGKLNDFTGSRPHQNVVLKCSKLEYLSVKKMRDVIDLDNR